MQKPVKAALARAGKSIPEQKSAAEKLSTRKINPTKYREVVSEELPVRGKRFEELDSMDRHDRVANLIKVAVEFIRKITVFRAIIHQQNSHLLRNRRICLQK